MADSHKTISRETRGPCPENPGVTNGVFSGASRGWSGCTTAEGTKMNRFARVDSQKNPRAYFHNVRAIRANCLKPAIRKFLAPQSAIRKKGLMRIDSRESGHLRSEKVSQRMCSEYLSHTICPENHCSTDRCAHIVVGKSCHSTLFEIGLQDPAANPFPTSQ